MYAIKMAREFLSRCSVSQLYTDAKYYYAFGNTKVTDLLGEYDVNKHCDVLLLASGDIRHLVKTVSGMNARPKGASRASSLSFHVNDFNSLMVARNVVLLEMIMRLDVEVKDDFVFLWSVWYNVELSARHHGRLVSLLKELSAKTHLTRKCWKICGEEATLAILDHISKWATDSLEVEEVTVNRHKEQACEGMAAHIGRLDCLTSYCDRNSGLGDRELIERHFERYRQTGCVHPVKESAFPEGCGKVNPTFLMPGSATWQVHSLNPFTSFAPLTR